MVTMRATRARLAGAGDDDRVARPRPRRRRSCRHSRGSSAFGRLTHCTGKRNGFAAVAVRDVDRLEMLEQRRARRTRACARSAR